MAVVALVVAAVVSCYFLFLLLGGLHSAAESCVCLVIALWIYIIGL